MDIKQIKQEAIGHYDRMIAWAEKQDKKYTPTMTAMFTDIGETYRAEDCSFCQNFTFCAVCPLSINSSCCGGNWIALLNTNNWEEWVVRAEIIKSIIKSV